MPLLARRTLRAAELEATPAGVEGSVTSSRTLEPMILTILAKLAAVAALAMSDDMTRGQSWTELVDRLEHTRSVGAA